MHKRIRANAKGESEMRLTPISFFIDIFDGLSHPRKQGWFIFAIFLFLMFFLGGHLAKAITTLGIPNIRTTDIVQYSNSPFWFVVIASLKLVFFAFSVFYVAMFISRVVKGK